MVGAFHSYAIRTKLLLDRLMDQNFMNFETVRVSSVIRFSFGFIKYCNLLCHYYGEAVEQGVQDTKTKYASASKRPNAEVEVILYKSWGVVCKF